MGFFACFKLPGFRLTGALGLAAGVLLPVHSADGTSMTFNGAGWMQFGSIVKSTDTSGRQDLNGRTLLSSGAQFELKVNPSEKWRVEAGLGAAAGHALAASSLQQGGYAPMDVNPYVSNANFTYSFMEKNESGLFLRGGLFSYIYNPDVQNLGLYLLRGPVYPGYLLSGFETREVLPVANTLGFQLNHKMGSFEQDLVLAIEKDFYPYWDMSPAYIASYTMGGALRIGGGVNFYHLISVDPELTTDTTKFYIDNSTGVPDTTAISFQGIKLMANASLDLKALFGGSERLGSEDLKIYGEVALIGLDDGPAYKKLYGEYKDRMPIMVGMNLPAFKVLDRLSLEVEMHSARFKDDLTGYNPYGNPTPIPFGNLDTNYAADNFRWSLYGSRIIQKHIKLSVQAASDHFRPGVFRGYGDNNPPSRQAIFFKPDEWYWMTKIAYFF